MNKSIPMVCLAVLSACTTPADVSRPLVDGSDNNARTACRAFAEAIWKDS